VRHHARWYASQDIPVLTPELLAAVTRRASITDARNVDIPVDVWKRSSVF
jgi:hypothetical protein